jgi:hypothetical protein
MSELAVRMGGGWLGSGFPEHMSDSMVRRLAQAEVDEQRAEREAARALESIDGDLHTRALVASGVLAAERGEYFTPREVLAGEAGRTRQEVLAYAMAQMDREDAQQVAALRKAGYRDPLSISEDLSADVSAPLPADLEADQALVARGREVRREQQRIRHIARGVVRAYDRGYL